MDDHVAEQLRRYARGEVTSRSVRDATGLDYAQVLDGLGERLREHVGRNVDCSSAKRTI